MKMATKSPSSRDLMHFSRYPFHLKNIFYWWIIVYFCCKQSSYLWWTCWLSTKAQPWELSQERITRELGTSKGINQTIRNRQGKSENIKFCSWQNPLGAGLRFMVQEYRSFIDSKIPRYEFIIWDRSRGSFRHTYKGSGIFLGTGVWLFFCELVLIQSFPLCLRKLSLRFSNATIVTL